MEWCKSPSGFDVIRVDDDSYVSFGDEKNPKIKWIRFSFAEGKRRINETLPISLNKIPKVVTLAFGKKNIAALRMLIKERVEGDNLPREKFNEIGEIINIEYSEAG